MMVNCTVEPTSRGSSNYVKGERHLMIGHREEENFEGKGAVVRTLFSCHSVDLPLPSRRLASMVLSDLLCELILVAHHVCKLSSVICALVKNRESLPIPVFALRTPPLLLLKR